MKSILKWALAAAAIAVASQASAQITFYEHSNFEGRAFTANDAVFNFNDIGFNDQASSVIVTHGQWEVCEHAEFHGRCMILRPGYYRSLRDMDMNNMISSVRPVRHEDRHDEGRYAPQPMAPQVTFYEHDNFQGRGFTTLSDLNDFRQIGFNDRASSVIVFGERWEACEDVNYGGRCVILTPGRYPSLGAMGLNDRLSSVRAIHPAAHIDDRRYAPPPAPVYDWRRRPQEQLYSVNVNAVRAIYGAPQQRCWIEREQVTQSQRGEANLPGAVVGGVIGGILGHQIGGGTGRDIATIGGVFAGAAIGANAGRDNRNVTSVQDVQRCTAVPQQRPEFWDVTYYFRGVEHHMQMTSLPGPTITVNENGEPRL
jgi:uncharacterized protein YcfJ